MLLQTKGVLTRPWVILELYTAITNQVPVVALNVMNNYAYEYSEASELLMHLDEVLDRVNPGAADLLREQGVDPVDAAFRLSSALPGIISTDFYPNGSTRQIEAALEDPAASRTIAQQGHEHALKYHGMAARIDFVLQQLTSSGPVLSK